MSRTVYLAFLALSWTAAGPQSRPPAQRPLRICLLQDLSGSIFKTRTPRLDHAQLRQFIELIRQRGGELALGVLQERSDATLLRLRAEAPPPPPPPEPRNPFQKYRWRMALAEHQRRYQLWLDHQNQREAAFLEEAYRRLKSSIAPRTDLCSAVLRCDLMLSEAGWDGADGVLLLITDGQENARRSACPTSLNSAPTVLLVNGSGSLGVLAPYKPLRFESIPAAIDFLRKLSQAQNVDSVRR